MTALKSSRLLYALYCIATICGMAILLYSTMLYSDGEAGKLSVALAAASLIPTALLFVVLLLRWKQSPEKVFLVVAVPATSAFALFLLPDHIPDEIWHIYRVLSIEDPGSAMVVPAALRQDLLPTTYSELHEAICASISWEDTMLVERDMSSYLSHLYLIPGLVSKACALFGLNPFLTIYIARFTNAAIFITAGYWIIKIIPMAKVCMCVYLLNPMMIQQEASCSADAVTNVLALFFIATIIWARFKNSVSIRDMTILVILFAFTSISKFAYSLLVFLFLLLVPIIASKRKRVAIYLTTCVLFILGMAFVLCFANSAQYQDTLDLIRSPHEFLWVMKNTFREVSPIWIEQFGGHALSNLDVITWEPCFWAYVFILLFSLVFNLGEIHALKRTEKIGIVALVAFMSVAIISVFRNWSITVDLRSDVILGVQGRYFLPYCYLLLLCCSTPQSSLVRNNCLVLYSAILACIFALDSYSIMAAFA